MYCFNFIYILLLTIDLSIFYTKYNNKEKGRLYMKRRQGIVKLFVILFLFCSITSFANKTEITKQEVLDAQQKWSSGLIAIGKAYINKQDYKKVAESLVDDLYGYGYGDVLFKPTKASQSQFRTTKEGALSYFIGENKSYPEDKGFALEPWIKVIFNNAALSINNNVAMTMGTYLFTPLKGTPVEVEYTFVYEKENDGKLVIVLHHSSLPYNPN